MTSNSALWTELQEQGRATVAAFTVVGVSYLYTMESWWHAWQFRMRHLLVFTVAGLVIVLVLSRVVGFHEQNRSGEGGGTSKQGGGSQSSGNTDESQNGADEAKGGTGEAEDGESERGFGTMLYGTLTSATEAIAQSFVASYIILFLFGVLTLEDSLSTAARLGVFYVVPLGFGAALANNLFAGSNSEQPSRKFVRTVGLFSLGAIFLSAPIALTQEMELIAVYTSWSRLAALLVTTLFVTHLTLFELEIQGQSSRVRGRTKLMQAGHTFTVYLIGVVVAASLLLAFGHFQGQPPSVWVQETVILSFPTSVGASAAQVVL